MSIQAYLNKRISLNLVAADFISNYFSVLDSALTSMCLSNNVTNISILLRQTTYHVTNNSMMQSQNFSTLL